MLKFALPLLALVLTCHAYGNVNFFANDVNDLLECFVQNPLYGDPGQPFEKLEDPPRIPFVPNIISQLYLPLSSGFPMPPGYPDPQKLIDFIGDELSFHFVSTAEPPVSPQLGINVIPLTHILTSGGEFESVTADPEFGDLDPIWNYTEIIQLGLTPEEMRGVVRVHGALRTRCFLTSTWVKLSRDFWPPYFGVNHCTGYGCSIPEGLNCHPVISERTILYTPGLRWDCCWNLKDRQWRWECGWRKVLLPLISKCHCGCGPKYVGDGISAIFSPRINFPVSTTLE